MLIPQDEVRLNVCIFRRDDCMAWTKPLIIITIIITITTERGLDTTSDVTHSMKLHSITAKFQPVHLYTSLQMFYCLCPRIYTMLCLSFFFYFWTNVYSVVFIFTLAMTLKFYLQKQSSSWVSYSPTFLVGLINSIQAKQHTHKQVSWFI